jgi:hypothetical protein
MEGLFLREKPLFGISIFAFAFSAGKPYLCALI